MCFGGKYALFGYWIHASMNLPVPEHVKGRIPIKMLASAPCSSSSNALLQNEDFQFKAKKNGDWIQASINLRVPNHVKWGNPIKMLANAPCSSSSDALL